MKFEDFHAGVLVKRYQYQSFEPELINHEWGWDDAVVNTLLESANRALGELNAFSLIVPDIDLFVRMHVIKEAQQSSRIEGTQTARHGESGCRNVGRGQAAERCHWKNHRPVS